MGIPRPLQARVFDEYFQIGNPERDRRKGLGLGLAIVRDLSKLLGVRVRLRSTEGRGTVLAMDIPGAAPPARRDSGPSSPANDFVKGALVLLIDDDPLAREGMATTLRRFGCRVLDAAAREDALQLLATSEFVPQVIVSDLRLAEGVNGAQLAAELADHQSQALGPEFRPGVLVVTGDTLTAEITGVGGIAPAVLRKPVAPEALHATLSALLVRTDDGTPP